MVGVDSAVVAGTVGAVGSEGPSVLGVAALSLSRFGDSLVNAWRAFA